MFNTAHNDRTIVREVKLASPSFDLAFQLWLKRQVKMLESWEQELLLQDCSDEMLTSLQKHRDWMASSLQSHSA